VNVTLDTREKMEAHARSAVSTNTKLAWDLLLALLVHQTLRRQLEASRTLPVNATQGTKDKMEAHAPCATQALIKLDSGLLV